ncbi:FAD/NAD(P)-binding protein [Metabacillus iocasae]|uniref:Thioredoxin reductase n=1 Tax=Priestia iocasae TaxID=2291674 RepID=A0ABS2QZC5_9BACI|nr:FAD/NAD(P)-binding protein [Metabacillus iocasae]MBM7704829.1 thioredoxin reductase [Metabacillus iocasae]
MYDWIIVGGGMQGITLATFLIKEKKTTMDRLAIVDPHDEPLANWKHCTGMISMPFLRSPSVHHIDVAPFSLQAFANKEKQTFHTDRFYGQYKRPSLPLFNDHCDHIIEDIGLKESWHQGKVIHVNKQHGVWTVMTNQGEELVGRNLVLSIGIGEQRHWPEWAIQLKEENQNSVHHIFDSSCPSIPTLEGSITIIGGGITAVHTAIKAASLHPGMVTMIKRHPFRVHDFDSNPAWLGPKNQVSFRLLDDYRQRREAIKKARNKGSIPRELSIKMKHLERKKHLTIIDDTVVDYKLDNQINLLLKKHPSHQTANILLATGFEGTLPGKEWIEPLIHDQNLKCASCGYPIVSHSLQWGPNLYVTGALAELQVGPIARNISGARQAAQLIVNSL